MSDNLGTEDMASALGMSGMALVSDKPDTVAELDRLVALGISDMALVSDTLDMVLAMGMALATDMALVMDMPGRPEVLLELAQLVVVQLASE